MSCTRNGSCECLIVSVMNLGEFIRFTISSVRQKHARARSLRQSGHMRDLQRFSRMRISSFSPATQMTGSEQHLASRLARRAAFSVSIVRILDMTDSLAGDRSANRVTWYQRVVSAWLTTLLRGSRSGPWIIACCLLHDCF